MFQVIGLLPDTPTDQPNRQAKTGSIDIDKLVSLFCWAKETPGWSVALLACLGALVGLLVSSFKMKGVSFMQTQLEDSHPVRVLHHH